MNYTQRPKSRRTPGKKPQKEDKKAKESEKQQDDDYDDIDDKPIRKKASVFKKLRNSLFPVKGDPPTEAVRKIIFDVAVLALLVTGGSLLYDVIDRGYQDMIIDSQVGELYQPQGDDEISGEISIPEEEKEAVLSQNPKISDSFIKLYAENNDIVGWLKLGEEGSIINHPVMQADDNDYYLNKNFYKKDTKSGAIFADFRNNFENGETSANTVLYGHNIWDGSMFAKLTRYYNGTLEKGETDRLWFYKKYPTVTFDTIYEPSEWKVFACVLFNTQEENGEVYPYTQIHDFDSKEAFNSFILDIMDRSVLWTDVDLTYGDEILTLSTCYYPYGKSIDTRCVVFARKVRDGESAGVDISKAQVNENPLKFSYQYQVEGGSWKGRSWDTSKLLSY